jgi:hypothetical protein
MPLLAASASADATVTAPPVALRSALHSPYAHLQAQPAHHASLVISNIQTFALTFDFETTLQFCRRTQSNHTLPMQSYPALVGAACLTQDVKALVHNDPGYIFERLSYT